MVLNVSAEIPLRKEDTEGKTTGNATSRVPEIKAKSVEEHGEFLST